MEVNIKYELKDHYVLITSEGERKDFSSVVDGTTKLYAIIEQTHSTLVMLDYRKVIFNVPQTDAFNIVRLYELKMPLLTHVKIAVVLASMNSDFANVWKNVAQAKGFQYEIFTELKEAEAWLLS